jgi:hypothetical protein
MTDTPYAIKRTGRGVSLTDAVSKFENMCEECDELPIQLVVTDDEHELLSLDATTPFIFIDEEYNSVMEAYNKLKIFCGATNDNENEIQLMYILISEKFKQNLEARAILSQTTGKIIYKSNDDFWGMKIPEFEGNNVAGIIIEEIRNEYDPLIA